MRESEIRQARQCGKEREYRPKDTDAVDKFGVSTAAESAQSEGSLEALIKRVYDHLGLDRQGHRTHKAYPGSLSLCGISVDLFRDEAVISMS